MVMDEDEARMLRQSLKDLKEAVEQLTERMNKLENRPWTPGKRPDIEYDHRPPPPMSRVPRPKYMEEGGL